MKLSEFLEFKSMSVADFAKQIGAKSRATVYRYMFDEGQRQIPNAKMMLKIMQVTDGNVTPTDFYSVPKPRTKRNSNSAQGEISP